MQMKQWLSLSILIAIIAACTPTAGGAAALLPDIPTANIVEGRTLTEFLSSLPGSQALKTSFPQVFTAAEFVDQVTGCYQKIGAVAVRVYSDKQFPLSSGTVAIVDRNALTDPANFVNCVAANAQSAAPETQPALNPCAKTYTLQKDNNEFYIAYIASTQEMCQAICSGLQGCSSN
jgi:hypothetical protein